MLLLSATSQAQEDYASGYYITYSGDTIHTQIKVLNSKAGKKIGYLNAKGRKRKFSGSDVKEYHIKGFASYASIAPFPKAPKVRFFADIVVDGQARLLYYGFKKKYYLTRIGNSEAIKIKKLSYRKQLMQFFQDFDELREDLKKKRITYGQIETAVTRYNTWYVEFYLPYQRSLK
jgi:hypothetical protein